MFIRLVPLIALVDTTHDRGAKAAKGVPGAITNSSNPQIRFSRSASDSTEIHLPGGNQVCDVAKQAEGCWGLDRRECARRLIPASKKSPNLSAGLRCWVTSAHEGCSVPTKTPGTEKLTFGAEGEGRTLRSTSLRSATCEASKESPSGDRRRQSIAPSPGRR